MGKNIAGLEKQLVEAKGNPQAHAQARNDIREAGLPHLADELDRIAGQSSKK